MTRLTHLPLAAAVLAPALAGACIDRSVTELEPVPENIEHLVFYVHLNPNLDILFVVDDSGSMEREQNEIIENFHRMIEVLETLPTGLPNLHLGVVSTDVGGGEACGAPGQPAGVLRNTPMIAGCAPPTDRWIVDVDDGAGGRTRNYTGELADTFACIAALGTDGCGFEQPLEAMRLALSPDTVQNRGFLRDDALLAVVLLTDEDDCSAFDDGLFTRATDDLGPLENFRCFEHGVDCEGIDPRTLGPRENCVARDDSPYLTPVDEYAAFLQALKPVEGRLLVAGIMGDPGPIEVIRNERGNLDVNRSCEIDAVDPQGAFPPIRTDTFLSRFPEPIRHRICDADLSPAMVDIAEAIVRDLVGFCIQGTLADASAEPGLQADCSVTEVQHPFTDDEVRTVLPRCVGDPAATDRPCWTIEENDECATDHQLRVAAYYPPNVTRDRDTIIQAQCRTE